MEQGIWKKKINLILVFYKEILRFGKYINEKKKLLWVAVNTNPHFKKSLDAEMMSLDVNDDLVFGES